MRTRTYTLRFLTPAFLGNAKQLAQWRTPPFKALIRQWWRIVKAKDVGYDHTRLRTEEMRLFGAASDSGSEKSHRSLVRLRLSAWDEGRLPKVEPGEPVHHPGVPAKKDRNGRIVLDAQGNEIHEVGANLYLGYGPIGGQTRNAIDPKEAVHTLVIHCPEEYAIEIQKAMQLAAWFGTLGSRSRNGWGSIDIEGQDIKGFSGLDIPALTALAAPRPLDDCLKSEWLHAVGSDNAGNPLVWRLLRVNHEKKGSFEFRMG